MGGFKRLWGFFALNILIFVSFGGNDGRLMFFFCEGGAGRCEQGTGEKDTKRKGGGRRGEGGEKEGGGGKRGKEEKDSLW